MISKCLIIIVLTIFRFKLQEQLQLLEQRKLIQQQMCVSAVAVGTEVGNRSASVNSHMAAQRQAPATGPDSAPQLLPAIQNARHLYPGMQVNQQPQSHSLLSTMFIPPSSPPPHLSLCDGSVPLMHSSPISHPPASKIVASLPNSRPNTSRNISSQPQAKSTPIHSYLQQLEHNVYVRKVQIYIRCLYTWFDKQCVVFVCRIMKSWKSKRCFWHL